MSVIDAIKNSIRESLMVKHVRQFENLKNSTLLLESNIQNFKNQTWKEKEEGDEKKRVSFLP